jgi:hypothetical protein
LGRPTQTHHHSEGWVRLTKAHPTMRFGSVYPKRLQGLGRSTQTGCKVWIEGPKPAAIFGSSDPNRLQALDRSTQTDCKPTARFGWNDPNGCKVWVERPKPAARFCRGTQTSCKLWIDRPKPAANRLQDLGGTTQTDCKVWVEQYES